MRLSEYEQRVLDEVELALTRDDPRYARQFSTFSGSAPRRWRRLRRVLRALHLRRS